MRRRSIYKERPGALQDAVENKSMPSPTKNIPAPCRKNRLAITPRFVGKDQGRQKKGARGLKKWHYGGKTNELASIGA